MIPTKWNFYKQDTQGDSCSVKNTKCLEPKMPAMGSYDPGETFCPSHSAIGS